MTQLLVFLSLVFMCFLVGWRKYTGRAQWGAIDGQPVFDWVLVAYILLLGGFLILVSK